MELINKRNLAALSVVFSVVFGAYLFISGLSVNTVVTKPESCQLIQTLQPIHFTDDRFITALFLKNRARRLGADTLYLPLSASVVAQRSGVMMGEAYDCSAQGLASQY